MKPVSPAFKNQEFISGERLSINEYFQVIGLRDVFALGDVSLNKQSPSPVNAQAAVQQGEALAKVLIELRAGKQLTPFGYIDRGEMLGLGIGNATCTAMGLTLSGQLAFHLRRMAYLTKMPRLRQKIKSLGVWLLDN